MKITRLVDGAIRSVLRPGARSAAAKQRGPGLLPGHAKVVESDGKPVGVYCDAGGRLQAVTAICTHLDWKLEFDVESRAWACPRHGARFATDGAVLAGPATDPLAVVQLSDQLRKRLQPDPPELPTNH
ncbi:Rieske 2Fe-2S domain-containing protein [Antrihabitans sp. YC3-6]|uniref:Rieske 2Fe-2S domain-containing protein n=1 Tax=Antrihabitans stalagmiti TaxID=2799499 RepID=A0A934U619_9NOCA|nr:Rieske 2Fe-2S domain-containing protein [Antrihabitans stalagmiti]MBJ8342120.1 Rieske 2Fe-2S domain-containing protein [Antrihabitans stalagmiti]